MAASLRSCTPQVTAPTLAQQGVPRASGPSGEKLSRSEWCSAGGTGCRRGCGGKSGWRSLRLVQRARTGVGAPAETTPWTRIAARGLAEEALFAGEAWFDPIEAGLRGRIRGLIEELVEQELEAALGRGRYERAGGASGHRHGHRKRQLTGSFGPVETRGAAGPAAGRGRQHAGNGAAPCCRATPGGRASSRR